MFRLLVFYGALRILLEIALLKINIIIYVISVTSAVQLLLGFLDDTITFSLWLTG